LGDQREYEPELTVEKFEELIGGSYNHGGALLERLASYGDPQQIPFTIPL